MADHKQELAINRRRLTVHQRGLDGTHQRLMANPRKGCAVEKQQKGAFEGGLYQTHSS